MKKICILIPCYNEEKGIRKVIETIPKELMSKLDYLTEIIVIDNNSTDNTATVATSLGAKVIFEKSQGKGKAILTGFNNIPTDTDVVVMIDGDNTYDTFELIRLVEPIANDFCDVVVGSRLQGRIMDESMSYFNRIGNWLLTFLVRVGYGVNVTDVCSGYFAWRKEVVDVIKEYIDSSGYTVEMEMVVKMAKMKFFMTSVPISYHPRAGRSNLSPVRDGWNIFATWAKYLYWSPRLNIKSTNKEMSDNSLIHKT